MDIAIVIIVILDEAAISLTDSGDFPFFIINVVGHPRQITHRNSTTIRIVGIKDLTFRFLRILGCEQLIQLVVVIGDGFAICFFDLGQLVIDIVGIGFNCSQSGHSLDDI